MPPFVDGTEACADVDTALFFSRHVAQAKAYCAACPAEQPCLQYALTATGVSGVALDGVWGGTTRPERARMRAKLKLPLGGATP
jgi:hypothetical protein